MDRGDVRRRCAKKQKRKSVADAVPIAIADLKREKPVDFESEVLPALRRNCIACHNGTKSENHLVLETPQTILKGGDSGPAVVPKRSGESLLLKAAAHLDDPTMPPPDNNVKAVPLSPDELGLIKLWIDQGAGGQVTASAAPLKWQKLPPTVSPILAVADRSGRPVRRLRPGERDLRLPPRVRSARRAARRSGARWPVRRQGARHRASRSCAIAGVRSVGRSAGLGRISRSEALAAAA